MSTKDKLEKDYKKFNMNIERIAEEEIKKIQEETIALKEEASRIGEAVELSLKANEAKTTKKKVNT
jgi:inorganic pyrophosphatase/exopolyphosphatase